MKVSHGIYLRTLRSSRLNRGIQVDSFPCSETVKVFRLINVAKKLTA